MMKGVSPIIATILMLMITIGLASMAYMYISGMFRTTASGAIQVIGASCDAAAATGYYVTVKNLDPTNTLATGDLTVYVDGALVPALSVSWTPTSVDPGRTTTASISVTGGTAGTYHPIKVIGPSNSGEIGVYCE